MKDVPVVPARYREGRSVSEHHETDAARETYSCTANPMDVVFAVVGEIVVLMLHVSMSKRAPR